jgi:3-deoxy-D-manno-octulosonate 8-phosphate phosphatase (KDO 8-P phosphatase)
MSSNATQIKLVIFDIDGVMTDGKLYYTREGDGMKGFNAKDGLGIKMLMQSDIHVAVITGRQSEIVSQRTKELGIDVVYQGQANKLTAFEHCQQHFDLPLEQIAYMGDDINDLPLMQRVGFAIAPANAVQITKDAAHYICALGGGEGAVREACDHLLQAQDKWQTAIDYYAK